MLTVRAAAPMGTLATMGWTFVWLMVALKVPIAALLYLVWWAVHQTDDEPAPGGDGGVRPPHPPRAPRSPRRRGPHGTPAMRPPSPRTRTVIAARRQTQRHHP